MFFDTDICGDRLPGKTICLTYDDGPGATAGDGPGPQTLELARYLHEQEIQAAFFVIGAHARARLNLLRQISAWGHIIGNHTYSHPGLVKNLREGNEIVSEIVTTDDLIRSCSGNPVRFLRAPYGSWREEHRSEHGAQGQPSIVAEVLNGSDRLSDYVGHIHWDICACDYEFWKSGASARECADSCLEQIARIGRGIVLLHDSSEDMKQRALNRTREVTELIVPRLIREGYTFISLDQIPQVRSAMMTRRLVRFGTTDGRTLGLDDDGSVSIRYPNSTSADQWGLVPSDNGEWLMRAPNGCFLSASNIDAGSFQPSNVFSSDKRNVKLLPDSDGQLQLRFQGATCISQIDKEQSTAVTSQ